MSEKHFCDICTKEIFALKKPYQPFNKIEFSSGNIAHEFINIEVCNECYTTLLSNVESFIESRTKGDE